MIRIERALISVSDKTGIVELAKVLKKYNVEIISTGGTYKYLLENYISSIMIEEITQFPEILDGRVKTLHPKIHGGLLARMDFPEHVNTLKNFNIPKIDMVVVNLYPFVQTKLKYENSDLSKEEISESIIENIDIGGPAMIRSAAKNHFHTVVVCDPNDYSDIILEIENLRGYISKHTSKKLAAKAFSLTASYDASISMYFNEELQIEFPETLTIPLRKVMDLRYGENPHQQASFYRSIMDYEKDPKNPYGFKQYQGKDLSFNNILDLTAAMQCALSIPNYGVVIVKHLNPCGASFVREEKDLVKAFIEARECDPISAFGGIIAINGNVDKELAKTIVEHFYECVIARSYTKESLEVFSAKSNLRVIQLENPKTLLKNSKELRMGLDGYLYQDLDVDQIDKKYWEVVTEKKPTEEDLNALEFAWNVVKYIKSNAIIFTDSNKTLAIGAGQMSRVDSVELAIYKAVRKGISLQNSYVASDAFFPFPDGVEVAAKAGAKAIIQPGGSLRDKDVIQTANKYGLIMIFTGQRHFRH
ncbi:MAG: bifunctional phosphoribosylaminoimidazolecarboxamide formyltransferase/IMP cyclohydrolase [Leptonema sp. (in: bacteria)]